MHICSLKIVYEHFACQLPINSCNFKSLRKLIRKMPTGAFLNHRAEWTDDVSAAENFATEDAVKSARRRFQLDGCELYYSFSKEKATEYDFSIPLWG
jgi:hypothetical protein